MKILLVRPRPTDETIGLQHLMLVEPLDLEVLCALKRPGDEVVIVDMILEKQSIEHFIKLHQPDLLGVTGYISNVQTMIDYCRIAKQLDQNISTVAGGVHCEVCPEDFDDPKVDFRMVRNATSGFTALLEHIDGKGSLPAGVLRHQDETDPENLPPFNFYFPQPDRSATSKYRDRYFYIFHHKVALMKTSFGCPFTCSFCFCRIITEGKYHQRPMQDIIDELKSIDEDEVYIVDDDFLVSPEWLRNFITELKKHNIRKRFLVYGRADFIAKHPELMHELAEAGLKTVIVGFESFSENELDRYNKRTTASTYADTMRILKQEKIDCFATVIIPPEWDREDFQNMVKAVKKLGIHFINLQPLTPLPKTNMQFPENKLVIPRTDYDQWDLAHVTVQPEKLSIEEFYKQILKAYMHILYRPETIAKYLRSYRPVMLLKMFIGGARVRKQYLSKIKKARNYA